LARDERYWRKAGSVERMDSDYVRPVNRQAARELSHRKKTKRK
jgi:hypothetical protein